MYRPQRERFLIERYLDFVDNALTSLQTGVVSKQPTPFFRSYAHADTPDVNRFMEVLHPLLVISAHYDFHEWNDKAILPGELWKTEINHALQSARFGLLLVSPQFLASKFITEEELATLLAKPTVVPIALHPIKFDGSMDLKNLQDRQLFCGPNHKTFDDCTTGRGRRAFALALFDQIHALLRKYPC